MAAGRLSQFKPQEVASLIWGYAKLGFNPGNLLTSKIVGEVAARPGAFKTMELCIILWAFAVLLVRDEGFMELFVEEVSRPERLRSMRPQCIANTMWAYGKFNQAINSGGEVPLVPSQSFVDTLMAMSRSRLGDFKPQELCQLIYAAAALDFVDSDLFDAVAEEAMSRLGSFKAQELVMLGE